MIRRRIKNEALDNVQRVVDGKAPDVVAQLDIVTAEAIQSDKAAKAHVDEINKELDKAAETVTPKEAATPETTTQNDFTAKLVLDESAQDFKLGSTKLREDGRSNKVIDNDGMDTYLDYDMFDFVYGLVTDCYPVPKNPISNPKKRKFMYIGNDNYANRPENSDEVDAFDLHAQVSSDGDSVTIYANEDRGKDEKKNTVKLGTVSAFDWIRAVCDLYKLKYSGPNPRRNSESHWEYSLTIYVPCESGYPMMVEDYFETIGYTMEDVMDSAFCQGYRKAQERERKEAQQYLNDIEVEKKFKAAVTAAAQDDSLPLEDHLKRLCAELTAAGLKYSKKKIKQDFMNAFDDGDDDE